MQLRRCAAISNDTAGVAGIARNLCILICPLRNCTAAPQYYKILRELRELREIYMFLYISIAGLHRCAAIMYDIAGVAGIARNIYVSLYFDCGIAPLRRNIV